MSLATHRGRLRISVELSKNFLRYVNRGWRLSSEAKVKLDHRERRLIFYITFRKEVSEYKPKGYVTVDVNENAEAVLIDGIVYLLETDLSRVTLGYYYRRKRVQERYDRVYGPGSRPERRIFKRLSSNEKALKRDIRWKLAALIVREAARRQAAIVLERLGKEPANHMIERIKDPQLRHRVFQAAFKGVQRAIEEKAMEYGVPVIYVNPKNTSRKCPIHGAEIVYGKDRHGTCSKGGETWHRDVVACYNLLLRALGGDGGSAPSRMRALTPIDGGPVPLGLTAAHEPAGVPRALWARWRSLRSIMNEQVIEVRAQGQTGWRGSSEPVGGRRAGLGLPSSRAVPLVCLQGAPKEDVEEAIKYAREAHLECFLTETTFS